ncbi:MAG: RDD family protein [Jiangellales bacterium]
MGSSAVAGPIAGAGPAGRVAAFGVDAGVIAAWVGAAAGVGWWVRRRQRSLSPAQADSVALGTLVAPTVVTFAVMEASARQATPGKTLVGLRVQSVEGHRLTVAHALARNAAKLAPWQLAHTAVFRIAAGSQQRRWQALAVAAQLMVVASAVTLLRDPHDRSWHDLLTRTRVVQVPRQTHTSVPADRP